MQSTNRYWIARVATMVAGVLLASHQAIAAPSVDNGPSVPVQVAAAFDSTRAPAASPPTAFPAHEAGVRAAAAAGPDALRRYIHRTRMIHNFYYYRYAREE